MEKADAERLSARLARITILRKRDTFRAAFAGSDPVAIARFGAEDVERLLANPALFRSRAKLKAMIASAHAYLTMAAAGEDFSAFVWRFAVNRQTQAVPLSTLMIFSYVAGPYGYLYGKSEPLTCQL